MNELNNTFDFDYESIKKSESFENIKVNINGYNLIKKNDNYYQGRRFEESGFNYYFDKSNNNWLATEIPQYGGVEREYNIFNSLEDAIEECENLC